MDFQILKKTKKKSIAGVLQFTKKLLIYKSRTYRFFIKSFQLKLAPFPEIALFLPDFRSLHQT